MKKKLAKLILIISILITIFLLTFIPHKLVDISSDDVSSIYIFCGRNGTHIEITDRDTINHIINNLDSITFQKDSFNFFRMGYAYRITIYTHKYIPYREFIINSDTNVVYWGFLYYAKTNKINYEFIQSLFS
ncbi:MULTISPECIES: hypothetical protein [unclassified Clostridium]|uniref:hypothetical protein n=1 Tax=unclassified Clostridium TaxID=2614128 RepID=UPI0002972C0A|nr:MULTISPECIES: hypothetical protein [unclassified Clostridium]EKQ56111.1 MAG: hypothetical protein A370_02333 [Clostridium sp. Maddingley MBC34-26]